MPASSSGYLLGAAVIIRNTAGQVLLGLRAKELLWANFGGRVEAHESATEAAIREVLEELGLRVASLVRLTFGEGALPDGTPFATVYFVCDCPEGQVPVNREPDKALDMRWFDTSHLPAEMWAHDRAALSALA